MSATIISVATHKGGVGKSTTVVNLSWALAEMGRKVLVVDADPQANTTSVLEGSATEKTMVDLINDPDVDFFAAKTPTRNENLYLIPSRFKLAEVEKTILGTPRQFDGLVEKLDERTDEYFDYIFIDCSRDPNGLLPAALFASHYYIFPIQAESRWAIDGIKMFLRIVEQIRSHLNPDLELLGALITMYDARTTTSKEALRNVKSYFGEDLVFETIIHYNTDLNKATFKHKTIFEYDRSRRGAKDYRSLAEEIDRKVNALARANSEEYDEQER